MYTNINRIAELAPDVRWILEYNNLIQQGILETRCERGVFAPVLRYPAEITPEGWHALNRDGKSLKNVKVPRLESHKRLQ